MLALVGGVVWLQFQPQLPAPGWLILLPATLVLLRVPWLRPLAAFACGVLWASATSQHQLERRLVPALEGIDLRITGVVVSLPRNRDGLQRFEFAPERIEAVNQPSPSSPDALPQRVRLSCHRCPLTLLAGNRYRLSARLKRPSGHYNPGSFDYEGWLFREGIQATGYVRENQGMEALGPAEGFGLLQLRQALRDQLLRQLDSPSNALITALAVGDRSGISPSDWQLYTRTGINHLVAISGLHIGIVIGLCYWVGNRLWRRWPGGMLWLPAQRAGLLLALPAALGYAALAGFSIPTQRALIMAVILLGGVLLGRPSRPSRNLLLALLVVVLWQPSQVLSPGLWLSFAAVAAILYSFAGRLRRPSLLGAWVQIQLLIWLLLMPFQLALGLQISLVSPLVNLLLVPLFSLLVVPWVLIGSLLGTLDDGLGTALLTPLTRLLELLSAQLQQIAGWPLSALQLPSPPLALLLVALAGLLIAALPLRPGVRLLGLCWLAPLLLFRPPAVEPGSAEITLLDVGQGMALVVQTHSRVLVYDTGPGHPSGFNTGSSVVAPFLRNRGLDRIDLLILSNGDQDHAGGVTGLLSEMPVQRILGGEPVERLPEVLSAPRAPAFQRCRRGQRWRWDGVDFALLHPDDALPWSGNDASCVLRVTTGGRAMLITGDIEANAERALLSALEPDQLRAEVVTMPHHGSAGSSSHALIRATGARWALVPVGYRNRYGFPRQETIQRWQAAGSEVLTSAGQGAIQLQLSADGVQPPQGWRQQARRYWHLDHGGL